MADVFPVAAAADKVRDTITGRGTELTTARFSTPRRHT